MAYTVPTSFDIFYENINLSGDYREIANKRRDNIVSTLNKSFDILEAFSTGSIPKYTALKNKADLDVIVAIHYGKHIQGKSPSEIIKDVRDKLSQWRTGARKNGQAVTLYYETWPNVDIVPVSQAIDDQGNVLYYNVPDSNTNTWIQSNPKSHASEIETKSSECGHNFRRIIKMIKHWNAAHGNYLQSYHIEVLAIKVFNSNLNDIAWNIFQFFEKARPLLTGSLWYGFGFADEYLSISDRNEILKRFDTAIGLSRAAWAKTYGTSNDHKGAIQTWKVIFGDKFPSYG